MTHLICSCGCESWSWSRSERDPIALDFTMVHTAIGHTVTRKATRSRPAK